MGFHKSKSKIEFIERVIHEILWGVNYLGFFKMRRLLLREGPFGKAYPRKSVDKFQTRQVLEKEYTKPKGDVENSRDHFQVS